MTILHPAMTDPSPSRIASILLIIALVLLAGPSRAQTVTVQNGAILWMHHGTLDLGATTNLVEEESSGARLTGGTGTVTATRTLNAPAGRNVAGLGAVISSSQTLGETVVTRGHAVQSDNGNVSIKRYFNIEPDNNNSLGATLEFHYFDAELNGRDENELTLFRSSDGGSTYRGTGYDTRSASTNTITLSGIDSFSRWTAGSEGEPLPVELVSFEGTQTRKSTVELTWVTTSETNNARYVVQRALDSSSEPSDSAHAVRTWRTLGTVRGAGTTPDGQTYTFTDEKLPYEAERLVYRLKQMDTDGTSSYSEPVTVTRAEPEKFQLKAPFPSPVHTRATLQYKVPEMRHVTVSIYDVLGRRVRTLVDERQKGRKQINIETHRLRSGTYFLRMRAGTFTETRRLVVTR